MGLTLPFRASWADWAEAAAKTAIRGRTLGTSSALAKPQDNYWQRNVS